MRFFASQVLDLEEFQDEEEFGDSDDGAGFEEEEWDDSKGSCFYQTIKKKIKF